MNICTRCWIFPKDLKLFHEVAERVARGQVPYAIQAAIKMGRMTALSKGDGGVRGIVFGDVVRRLVARTMSQQLMDAVQQATVPFQNAMATKAGCECKARVARRHRDESESHDPVSGWDECLRHHVTQGDAARIEGRSWRLRSVVFFFFLR